MSAVERAEFIRLDMERFLQDELRQMNNEAKNLIYVDYSYYQQIDAYERNIRATIERTYERNIKLFREEEILEQERLKRRAEKKRSKDDRLTKFANDPQNVHTTFLVQNIKEAIQIICAIPVDKNVKTLFEIISECNLDFPTVQELTVRYLMNEDIYELGPGIYKRVLDSVWQYIRVSANKDEIIKALRQELSDGVGLCAQGNLSRLCNVLKGHLPALDLDLRSKSEQLGSKFSALIGLDDRLNKGKAILQEMGVPLTEWPEWLDALT